MTTTTTTAIWNTKGGVLKTTIALCLAEFYAAFGQSVLLIDFNPDAGLSRRLKHAPQGRGSAELIGGAVPSSTTLRQASRLTDNPCIELIPTDALLRNVAAGLTQRSFSSERIGALANAVHQHAPGRWRHVIIDCEPGNGLLPINGLYAADRVVIPTKPDPHDIGSLGDALDLIAMVERERRADLPRCLVATEVEERTNLHKRGLKMLLKYQPEFPIVPKNSSEKRHRANLAAVAAVAYSLDQPNDPYARANVQDYLINRDWLDR